MPLNDNNRTNFPAQISYPAPNQAITPPAKFPAGVPGNVQPGQFPAGVPAKAQSGQQQTGIPVRTQRSAFPLGTATNNPDNRSSGDTNASGAKKKLSAKDYAVSLMIKLGVTAAVLLILFVFIIGIFVCHDNSSYPMIKDGDLCLTSRLSPLKQGDEIAYKSSDGSIRFGRVVALEGDSIEIDDGSITVNGYGVYENAVYPTTAEGASISFPYTVPEGCVFILNDYRSDISDSRTLGAIPVSSTKGKIFIVMRRRGI